MQTKVQSDRTHYNVFILVWMVILPRKQLASVCFIALSLVTPHSHLVGNHIAMPEPMIPFFSIWLLYVWLIYCCEERHCEKRQLLVSGAPSTVLHVAQFFPRKCTMLSSTSFKPRFSDSFERRTQHGVTISSSWFPGHGRRARLAGCSSCTMPVV